MDTVLWEPNFPSNKDFFDRSNLFPGDEIRDSIIGINPEITAIELLLGKDISEWKQVLYNKVLKIEVSYTCTLHYYSNGFLDDNGQVDRMTKEDMIRKSMFDFFIDTYFYHLYSAFDVVGQILNKRYKLGLQKHRIYFDTAVCDKLKEKNEELFFQLSTIKTGEKFKSAKLRNIFGHRIPPTEMLGFIIESEENKGVIKTAPYIPSKELVDMLNEALEVLVETIKTLKQI